MSPDEFLSKAKAAAEQAGHKFADYAACEAALESAWGSSKLALVANNLLGQKSGFSSREWPIIDMATDEIVHGKVEHLSHTQWPMFPDWVTCFRERMELLERLPAYKHALEADCGPEFVRRVSSVWATDPKRADKVLTIHGKHFPSMTVTAEENA